jgi:SAM-dependent methyltransferase
MNIPYKSSEIKQFYSQHRTSWKDFYPSEQFVFERIAAEQGNLGAVLDVGCAVGGLGRALAERFSITHYTGIDINALAIAAAEGQKDSFPIPAEFLCDDIVNLPARLEDRQFEIVTCLSCADWNLQPEQIIHCCWNHVAVGGKMVISLRLTNQPSVNDMARSYQFIHFGPEPFTGTEEKANYVILNVHQVFALASRLDPRPASLLAYGYWGKPSCTAVTVYDRIAFAVLALTKGAGDTPTTAEVRLPLDLLVQP